jgi:hypothetical protein
MNTKTRSRSFAKHQQRGVALILTLSILAMILVLVVSFATLSRTEGQSAGNYRDYVASRYLAQAALNRAMADVAMRFVTNAAGAQNGISTLYSTVSTNLTTVSTSIGPISNVVQYSALNKVQRSLAMDIDAVTNSKLTKLVFPTRGKDDIADYVVLPGTSANQAQWIGLKDTNGVYIGRIAYILTSGGLNINAIGNTVAHGAGGGEINSRNEGVDASELNLVGALMATDPTWTYANAKVDAQFIVDFRNGGNLLPGKVGDDNGNGGPAITDRIDNDGDGLIDEVGEGDDDPAERLAKANGTENDKISGGSVLGPDDTAFTDLKELHTGIMGNDVPSRTRFLSKFSNIQRVFTPQSSSEVDATMIGLSNSFASSDFMGIFNKLKSLPSFATNSDMEIGQCAANILSYQSAAPYVALPGSPVGWANTNIGVGRVPFINQVNFDFTTLVAGKIENDATGNPVTNIRVTVKYKPDLEFWYPYTNQYSSLGLNARVFCNFGHKRSTTFTPTTSGMAVENGTFTGLAIPGGTAIGGTPNLANITDASHLFKYDAMTLKTIFGSSPFKIGFTTDPSLPHYVITNLTFSVVEAEDGGFSKLLDFTPSHTTNLMSTCSLVINTNELIGAAHASLSSGGSSITLKHVIAFALNDPRVKSWGVEYAGTNFVNSGYESLGKTNLGMTTPFQTYVSGLAPSVPLFAPDLGEDKDYTKAGFIKGIAPKTFYVKNSPFVSVGEMGRVHRGQPWRTIGLKAGGIDGQILDSFSIASPFVAGAPNKPSYVHGAVNINARPSDMPTWAALFAGMPFSSEKYREANAAAPYIYFDTVAGKIDPTLTECKELGRLIGAKAGSFTTLSAITSVSELSNLSTNGNKVFKASPFNTMYTDEDKEWLIQHMSNLITTRGSGNVFTVWAWGQTLRGAPPRKDGTGTIKESAVTNANSQRYVAGETLLIASVAPKIEVDGVTGVTNLQMKVNYYRYNPDLELAAP